MNKDNENHLPQKHKTMVILREMSGDEKIREEAYYREKQMHDEASALGHARSEGKIEGRAEGRAEERAEIISIMRENGFTEEQIRLATTRKHLK